MVVVVVVVGEVVMAGLAVAPGSVLGRALGGVVLAEEGSEQGRVLEVPLFFCLWFSFTSFTALALAFFFGGF